MTFLSVNTVTKRYGRVTALENVSIDVVAGSRTAIVGPSGSGKTTLLRLIAGFEVPDSGQIVLDGELLAEGRAATPPYKRSIGIVAQDGALFPHLTVADNIGFGLDRKAPHRDRRILALMDMVELAREMGDRRPHQLSGGQQQRVALARALARQPKLMLLDEPFSALDTGLREAIRMSVAELLRAEKIMAILVTHDQAEALSFADQVAILREGKLLQSGPPRDLYMKPSDPGIASFFGDAIILSAEIDDGWAECELGRVEVSSSYRGKGRIMLRPEQVVLSLSNGAQPCQGTIMRIDFNGPSSLIALSLGKDGAPLMVKSARLDLPPVGSHVQISLIGQAHVFA
ncbi:ABC transporter ATP-binding protein [Phyllobacterium sp. BT25]|uniref:ABC transporter ATP-binding protein n=1 Tax=Phyllobacterium pellucidum TaxID=2740464 RepID=A0A849VUD0_9HYPH|nr:ABC transporter ATP-binding protein [Phyllobacterium pellucidum]NTS31453.1 ABC transporter ATP-binding protein [Phyllobacterium pellucidum]